MKNMKIKMKFVELKAAGIPMYKIAREIGVHRTTLTHWYKELASYILIAKQDMIDELLYENCSMKISRIQTISQNLAICYGLLENDKKRKEADIPVYRILDQILKYTKLLHIETNEKSIEKYIKGSRQEPEDEKLWITNKDNFHKFQPKDEEGTDLEDAVEIEEEDESLGYDININEDTLREIDEDDEQIQSIFKNTLLRKNFSEGDFEEEEKNAAIKEIEEEQQE